MGVYRTWDFICKECGHKFYELVDIEEPDVSPCITCGSTLWEKIVGAPMIAVASFPDGHRRRTDSNYQKISEAQGLRGQLLNKQTNDVAATKKEINKLLEVKK